MKELICFAFVILFLASCKPDCCYNDPVCQECPQWARPKIENDRKFQNIQVLLDLSDRINDVSQKDRDKILLKSIYAQFIEQIKSKGFTNYGLSKAEDVFDLSIASQTSTNNLKLDYESKLSSDYSTMAPYDKPSKVKERVSIFNKTVDRLYEEDFKFKGSLYSSYFYNVINMARDTNIYENILIVFSDGESDNFKVNVEEKGDLDKFNVYFIELSNESRQASEISNKKKYINDFLSHFGVKEAKKVLGNSLSPKNVLLEIFKKERIDTEQVTTTTKKKKLTTKIDDRKESEDHELNNIEKGIDFKKSKNIQKDYSQKSSNISETRLELLARTQRPSNTITNNKNVYDTKADISIWYSDYDKDGLGDPHSIQEVTEGTRPLGTWVTNANDKCPNRKGTIEGCPILHIESINEQILIGKEVEVTADPNGLLQSDELKWSGNSSLEFLTNGERSVNLLCNEVGKYKIKYKVQNAEFPIDGIAEREIEVKISSDQIRDIIQPVVVQGVSKGAGKFEQNSKKAMDELFRHTLSKRIPVFDELGIERDPLETFLTSDIKLGLPKNKHDLEIIDISYDKQSGKISEIYIKFL